VSASIADLLTIVSTIPRDGTEPVFQAPWEAQAFATAVHLHAQGVFSWPEWAACLAAEIRRAQGLGDTGADDSYYCHWLAALERLVIIKGLTSERALQDRYDAWDRAAKATAHGHPIALKRD
jgi:nitrile hydratase accessory protein